MILLFVGARDVDFFASSFERFSLSSFLILILFIVPVIRVTKSIVLILTVRVIEISSPLNQSPILFIISFNLLLEVFLLGIILQEEPPPPAESGGCLSEDHIALVSEFALGNEGAVIVVVHGSLADSGIGSNHEASYGRRKFAHILLFIFKLFVIFKHYPVAYIPIIILYATYLLV
jgi:hypothetical protein